MQLNNPTYHIPIMFRDWNNYNILTSYSETFHCLSAQTQASFLRIGQILACITLLLPVIKEATEIFFKPLKKYIFIKKIGLVVKAHKHICKQVLYIMLLLFST